MRTPPGPKSPHRAVPGTFGTCSLAGGCPPGRLTSPVHDGTVSLVARSKAPHVDLWAQTLGDTHTAGKRCASRILPPENARRQAKSVVLHTPAAYAASLAAHYDTSEEVSA